jgi:two-component system chemotaxis sensor kinase CheA
VRLSIAVLDGLMNEAGELMTCSLRARQLSREAQALSDLPARWRRMWRRISPSLARAREVGPAHDPVVHHLDDRAHAAAGRWRGGADGVVIAPARRAAGEAALARDEEPLLEALEQANALIGELTASLAGLSRQAAEDQTRLAAVTDRLHAQIRRTRMLPLTTLVNPLRLQVREMARAAGKRAALELDDRGAEADRQVLEQLREVFMHLLRNAIDHGIEEPEARAAAGKPELGTITLRASVSGDRLTITLEDDGAGISLEAVGRRAVAAGILGPAELERASEAELADLIFLPGFSTRQTVSALSGRGVGLDIVRSRVERMHGRVVVRSRPGAGTSFVIDVPLSLTSSHGLLLRAGGAAYVLPLDAVQRIVMPAPGQIQSLEGRPVLRVEGRPLPVATLDDLLGVAGEQPQAGMRGLALILGSGERQVACLVDAVLGEQELVVHRLPPPLLRVRFLSGATILADGRVVPILDVVDLVRSAAGGQQRAVRAEAGPQEEHRAPVILVADDSITTRTLEKNILEAAGYRVCLATDGQEALEALHRLGDDGGCDLLLSDIDMPRLNGFDLTAQVRADTRLRHLPVVLVTSLDSPADRERGVSAGADAYIVKRAFDQQTLLDTIAQLI